MFNGCVSDGAAKKESAFPDREEILARLKKYPNRPYFPPASDRKAWEGLAPALRAELIRRAEKAAQKTWPQLTARDYMRFRREGSRVAYEDPYFRRRGQLVDLVAGECCEHSGRFMDGVIEGLWQILSEPVWCIPAHEGLPRGEVFPDPSRFRVDLFNADTGRILSDTLCLLEPEIAKISPALVERVKMELLRRVVGPAEKLNDENTWWFSGRNNWTVWCAMNLSGCAISLLENEPERLADFLHTYLTISRRFYDRYPADGGCGEGPTYWRASVGRYIQFLDRLDHRLHLGGRLFKDAKLRRMCEYPAGMTLCGPWFLSTNDAAPRPGFSPEFLDFTARKVGSAPLAGLARRLPRSQPPKVRPALNDLLLDIFNPVSGSPDKGHFAAVNYWPDLGIAVLREKPAHPEKGTVVTLKGGSNGESHNHFDLGHFTIMRANKPLIVDIGAGVYTAQTFSETRYQLWYINSEGHNAPRFSDAGQEYGDEYVSRVTVRGDSETAASLDHAYPPAVGVKHLTRTVKLDRKTGNVEVADSAELAGPREVKITLYSAVEPQSHDKTCVKWSNAVLETDGLAVSSVAEERRLDAHMKKSWHRLWRIDLAGKTDASGGWKIRFRFDGKK